MFAWLARILFFRIGMRLLQWTWDKVQGKSARGRSAPTSRGSARRTF